MTRSYLLFLSLIFLVVSCGETKESKADSEQVSATPKLFYVNHTRNEEMREPKEVPLEEALSIMEKLPASDGNLLGLELSGDEMIQFQHDRLNGWELIILQGDEGTFRRPIPLEVCLEFIELAYDGQGEEEIKSKFHSY